MRGRSVIDKGRLERARLLPIEPLGDRQYKVGSHYVDLNGETPCHCRDALLSMPEPVACKHQARALMYECNPIIMDMLKSIGNA